MAVADVVSVEKEVNMSSICSGEGIHFDSKSLENLLKRRFFVAPSFEIYGSAAGLYDFGPSGCAVKNEIEAFWRRHFVMEEDLMEICGPNLTPHPVLKASGHVERFLDLMVEDTVTKECFRADKLIEDWLDKILADPKISSDMKREVEMCLSTLEGASAEEMQMIVDKYKILSPQKNALSAPYPFNLMFSTKIGPKPGADENTGVAYLRPETAQGIFVNFRRLLEQNNQRMPFGAACVGTSFRNEIAPRNGLLRVREFPMAEIEFFCDPTKKSPFPKFHKVKDLEIPLFPRNRQLDNSGPVMMTLDEAVETKIIDNETLAYFIGRTFLFLQKIGVNLNGLRFRQHLATEMAHYASDCWDAELLTSFKWVECVGIADRSAYDLSQHAKATKVDLQATRPLAEPRIVEKIEVTTNRKLMGPVLKKDLQKVLEVIEAWSEEEKSEMRNQLEKTGACEVIVGDSKFSLDSKLISFEDVSVKIKEEIYVPNVIEPSFGIGRIFYAVIEHAFRTRGIDDQEERNYLALSPLIAPVKCSILPISNQPQFLPIIDKIRDMLIQNSLTCKIDNSTASIGKRYARTDEIGIPYGVTVDFQSVEDSTVTLREIETMEQIRIPIEEVSAVVRRLVNLEVTWKSIQAVYPKFLQQQV